MAQEKKKINKAMWLDTSFNHITSVYVLCTYTVHIHVNTPNLSDMN